MFSKVFWYCCVLFFVLSSKISFAQVDSLQKLNEIKVRVKREKNSIRLTQTADSLSFIKTSSYNVADAIRNFAGVNIKDYGGIGGLKTISVRSLGANHTGVQYDGINLSDAQNGQIDLGKLILDNIESINLYQAQPTDLLSTATSFSTANVISIVTKKPKFQAGKNSNLLLKLTAGSFGLIHPVIQYQQKLSDNWSANFNTSYQNANGTYKFKVEGDGSDTLASRSNGDLMALQLDGGFSGRFSPNNSIELRASLYDSERGLPGAVIFYDAANSSQRLWNKDFYTQLRFKQKLNDKWNLLLSSKFSENYTRYLDPQFLNQKGELDNRYTQNEYFQSAATTYQATKNLLVNYATDISFTTLNTNLAQNNYPTRTTFLQVIGAKYYFKTLVVEGNLLNTSIKDQVKNNSTSPSFSAYTPTFSFNYQIDNDFLLRGFYKHVFRYPTFNDLYYTNFGNRDLNPEKAIQYSFGGVFSKPLKGNFSGLNLSADLYYNQIEDKIIALPNKNLFIWSMYNLGSVSIYGADFVSKFNYRINQKATIVYNTNYTFQLALDKTDKNSSVYNNQIPYTPMHTITSNISYEANSWSVFYNHIFSSGRYYLGNNEPEYFVKGFSISDVSVSKQYKSTSLTAQINNIFNINYSIIRSFPMPGTSVRLTIKTTI